MKYREAYPQTLSEGLGLISELSKHPDTPWNESLSATAERLYGVRSGFKDVLETFLLVPQENRVALLAALYGEKWRKLWDVFKLSYNPLDAYRMTEKTDSTKTVESHNETKYGKVVDSVFNEAGTVTDNGSSSDNSNSSIYGFNSAAGAPSNAENATRSNQNTEGRDIDTTSEVTNSGTDTHTGNTTDTDNTSVEKSGNIGYTTPQELIRQEFELWGTPFFNMVFDDIDQFITIQVFKI